MCQAGSAGALAFFYFDHRDAAKLDSRSLLSSLLIQLSNQSNRFCEVLSTLYKAHDHGSRQAGEDELMQCLQDIITLPGQLPIYIILDALDECSNSRGLVSPRADVLEIIKKLINLQTSARFCIFSRLEVDIRRVLEPLSNHTISLDKHDGQNESIAEYIKSVVHSDSMMREWPEEDKRLVIGTLTRRCGGMYAVNFITHCSIF
jgi:hypothetical protein